MCIWRHTKVCANRNGVFVIIPYGLKQVSTCQQPTFGPEGNESTNQLQFIRSPVSTVNNLVMRKDRFKADPDDFIIV